MLDEIRFALRQLRKSPAFSCLTVLTLSIGIGMNTAMFSLIHDLFLRGLPFSDPGSDLLLQGGLIRDSAVQALAAEDAQLDLGDAEPTAVLGRVVVRSPLEALEGRRSR